MNATIHYIFDPLCGWCYAASPLLSAVNDRFGDQLEILFHPGLLFAEPRVIETSYREHIISADKKITQQTGLEFGAAYIEKVRLAPVLSYHSTPPAAALMGVCSINPKLGLAMLEAIQNSHYQKGDDVADSATLIKLAISLGLNSDEATKAFESSKQNLAIIAAKARNLMQQVGGNGFPTLILEQDGHYQKLNHSIAYGNPDVFTQDLERLLLSK